MNKPINIDGTDYYTVPDFIEKVGFMVEEDEYEDYDSEASKLSWMMGKKVAYVEHHSYFYVRAYDIEVLKEMFKNTVRYA